METAGYLLMGAGQVQDTQVFCTLVEQIAEAPSHFALRQQTWKPVEVELGWAQVLANSLRRNLQLIADRKLLHWWRELPLGEWAFVYSAHARDLIPDFQWLALRPCDHWQGDAIVRFQDRDFPELPSQMGDWMQQSISAEFRTYDARVFAHFLAPRLALLARKFV